MGWTQTPASLWGILKSLSALGGWRPPQRLRQLTYVSIRACYSMPLSSTKWKEKAQTNQICLKLECPWSVSGCGWPQAYPLSRDALAFSSSLLNWLCNLIQRKKVLFLPAHFRWYTGWARSRGCLCIFRAHQHKVIWHRGLRDCDSLRELMRFSSSDSTSAVHWPIFNSQDYNKATCMQAHYLIQALTLGYSPSLFIEVLASKFPFFVCQEGIKQHWH